MNNKTTFTRRRLLKLSTAAAVAIPTSHVLLTNPVFADDLPQLELNNPTAMALGYVHDTTTVDKAANPNHSADQVCANCLLVQGSDGDEWRPCAIFPGKAVNANGWCKSWAKKAG